MNDDNQAGLSRQSATAGAHPVFRASVAAVPEALAHGDAEWAVRLILQARDQVGHSLELGDACCAEDAPPSTGEQAWDVLLAVLIAHEHVIRSLDSPAWTQHLPRIKDELVLINPLLGEQRTRDETPPWLAKHGIYICKRDLTTY